MNDQDVHIRKMPREIEDSV